MTQDTSNVSSENVEQPSQQPLTSNRKTSHLGLVCILLILLDVLAPEVGLEPTTLRLTEHS
jgi:hypothetical protein